ncbi:MAG: hypothetical protein ACI9KK_002703 [Ascidiaceihabitans sp.]|jgi:hypothetical protein
MHKLWRQEALFALMRSLPLHSKRRVRNRNSVNFVGVSALCSIGTLYGAANAADSATLEIINIIEGVFWCGACSRPWRFGQAKLKQFMTVRKFYEAAVRCDGCIHALRAHSSCSLQIALMTAVRTKLPFVMAPHMSASIVAFIKIIGVVWSHWMTTPHKVLCQCLRNCYRKVANYG